MNSKRVLDTIALLEKRLKEASPLEAAKLTKKLVSLKEDWLN